MLLSSIVSSKRMKKYIVIFLALSAGVCLADEFLPDGRYVFTCSKLYTGLCDITSTNGQYRMTPIEKNRKGYIDFERSWTGKLKIVDSGMGYSEIAINLSGKAKLLADGSFAGRMRLTSYAIPAIPGRIEWSEWSLRPATQEEIHAGLLNGLKIASGSLIREGQMDKRRQKNGKQPWPEEKIVHYALLGGRDEGYSHQDVSTLREGCDDGILTIVSNQFVLSKKVELTKPCTLRHVPRRK